MDAAATAVISTAGEQDAAEIARLAGLIWRACYPGIISPEQIEYMLARMYARDVLCAEMREGVRFDLLNVKGATVGFSSYGCVDPPGVVKLHKLYLLPAWHGHGLGSRLLKHCEEHCRSKGSHRLILNVNKRNTAAIRAYERNGFTVVETVVVDIGGGFVMDDYVMAKHLATRK